MEIEKLNRANELIKAIAVIDKLETAFDKSNWIKFSTPDFKEGLDIPMVLWKDLRDFLKAKGNEYEKIFKEM